MRMQQKVEKIFMSAELFPDWMVVSVDTLSFMGWDPLHPHCLLLGNYSHMNVRQKCTEYSEAGHAAKDPTHIYGIRMIFPSTLVR